MKRIILFALLFASVLISFRTSAELTDADIDKIQLLILESEKRMKAEIVESENRMKAEITVIKAEIQTLNGKFGRLEGKFDTLEKSIDRQNNIMIACISIPMGLLVVVVAIWGILAQMRDVKGSKELETLKQEIENLKAHRTFSP